MSSPSLQSVFDQMGKSMPLEIGHDRLLSGTRAGVSLSSPIPKQVMIREPIPAPRLTPSFGDVLTKSALPAVVGPDGQYLITTQVGTPAVEEAVKKDPEEVVCTGPQGLCFPEVNQALFDILMSKPVDISCARDIWEFYPISNPSEGKFTWKHDREFIYRKDERSPYESSYDFTLEYSRWGPRSDTNAEKSPPRVLLVHDALDSRRSWWCCQKHLSSFCDVVSVDLLGSGGSTKPRGLNTSSTGSGMADPFPWSFRMHAQYLVGMAQVFWPNESFFVAGVGWGAQIAASMATITDRISGFIMINPPGFDKNAHPELHYADIYNLARVQTDEELNNLSVSFSGRVRDCLIRSFSSSDLGHSGRDSATSSTLRLVLDQYSHLDRRRVLLDQLVANANMQYQEFPATDENNNGLAVEYIESPCIVVSGTNDIIYPPEHRNIYPAVYYNSKVETRSIDTGHLAHIESPKLVAEIILDFIREKLGFDRLGDAFIGFTGSSSGNERAIIDGLRSLYGL